MNGDVLRSFPLFDPNAAADASHQVRAPGGYECWYFDAEDAATDTQIVAIFQYGSLFHPGYLRAHEKYLKKPTRRMPVMPDAYPCVYLSISRAGKTLYQFMSQYGAGDYQSQPDRMSVRIGTNVAEVRDNQIHIRLSGHPRKGSMSGRRILSDHTLEAELVFSPRFAHAPMEQLLLSRSMTGAEHHWVIANPHCEVVGRIGLSGVASSDEQMLFKGVGYHDHYYGNGVIGSGLKRWVRGRAIVKDQVLAFQYAVPQNGGMPEFQIIRSDVSGISEQSVESVGVEWDRWSRTGLRYPKSMEFGSVLELRNPRVIARTFYGFRLMYEATFSGQTTTALCDVTHPARLRWPLVGRMVEMGMDRRG